MPRKSLNESVADENAAPGGVAAVDRALTRHLGQLLREKDLSAHRYQKFRALGRGKEDA